MKIRYILGLFIICLFLSACQKERAEEGYLDNSYSAILGEPLVTGTGEINKNVFMLTPEEDVFLNKVDSNIYTISNYVSFYDSIQVGSVVTAGITEKYPIAHHLLIEAIEEKSNSKRLTIKQASLSEVFKDLNFNFKASDFEGFSRSLNKSKKFKLKDKSVIKLDPSYSFTWLPDVNVEYDDLAFDYDQKNTIPAWMDFEIENAVFDGSVEFIFTGTASASYSKSFKVPLGTINLAPIGLPAVTIFFRWGITPSIKTGGKGSATFETKFTTIPSSTSISFRENIIIEDQFTGSSDLIKAINDNGAIFTELTTEFTELDGSFTIEPGFTVSLEAALDPAYSVTLYMKSKLMGLEGKVTTDFMNEEICLERTLKSDLKGGASASIAGWLNSGDYVFDIAKNSVPLEKLTFEMECTEDLEIPIVSIESTGSEDLFNVRVQQNKNSGESDEYSFRINQSTEYGPFSYDVEHNLEVDLSDEPNILEFSFSPEGIFGCNNKVQVSNPVEFTFDCPNGICEKEMPDGRIWMTKNYNHPSAFFCPESNCENFGGLYDYSSVSNDKLLHEEPQGICPDGWHIPTADEWSLLLEGVSFYYRSQMPKVSNFSDDLVDGNGLNLIPSGSIHNWQEENYEKGFLSSNPTAMMWTSSYLDSPQNELLDGSPIALYLNKDGFYYQPVTHDIGLACRCIKD